MRQKKSGKQEESHHHIPLEGQAIFRDLGGYQIVDGRSVKWRQVYRSGRLEKLTNDDAALLERLRRMAADDLSEEEMTSALDTLGIPDQELAPADEAAIDAEVV